MKHFNPDKLPVDLLQLSNRALNALLNAGINYINQLHNKTLSDLFAFKGMGKASAKEIHDKYSKFSGDNLELGENSTIKSLFDKVDIVGMKL